MASETRRGFLTACLGASAALVLVRRVAAEAGQRGLDAFVIPGAPCTPDRVLTPAVAASSFKAGAPERASLREAGTPGRALTFTGAVIGLSCGNVKGARVDLWQAGPDGVYDLRGFRYRGAQLTGEAGRFSFETVAPGPSGSRAPHLDVRVVPPGKAAFTTQLFFPNDPRNAGDPQFKPGLVMTMTKGASGADVATFDIILNI